MTAPVKLYVYDLSNGLARQMSLQLTGKQIDGIWHTSVIVFGREVFYGQGICETKPGQSHHGKPLQIVDMGETMIDEETFNDYLQELRDVYTADKYHLLEFNCNSFTDDVMGFLVGRSIPSHIKDLPTDFLSTPFGASLRPMIDNMFRRPGSGPATPQATDSLASSLLQSVASQAAAGPSNAAPYPTPAATPKPQTGATTVTAPLQICANLQHFQSILNSHRAVSAFFTSKTCPPCRIVEPIFEDLAYGKASNGVAFVKIDISSMHSASVANAYGIRATPTFLFFLDGKQVSELKGANAPELRSQVDLLLFQAYPPHPHTVKKLPKLRSISMDPILFSQVPALDAVQTKLLSFVDTSTLQEKESIATSLKTSIVPFLKQRCDKSVKVSSPDEATVKVLCKQWTLILDQLLQGLPREGLFPIIDLWRLGLLDTPISSWCASGIAQGDSSPVTLIVEQLSPSFATLPKPLVLTTLRMLCNCFSNVMLVRSILSRRPSSSSFASPREGMTDILVSSLLNEDTTVRTAAASLAFNISAFLQRPRMERAASGRQGENTEEEDIDWNVEILSAVAEALKLERASEDVVHRLTAAFAFILHLSPSYEDHLQPLVEVLQARETLQAKLSGGTEGFGENGVAKKDVRDLVSEVAENLC